MEDKHTALEDKYYSLGEKAQALIQAEQLFSPQGKARIRQALLTQGLETVLLAMPDGLSYAYEYLVRHFEEKKVK